MKREFCCGAKQQTGKYVLSFLKWDSAALASKTKKIFPEKIARVGSLFGPLFGKFAF